MRSVWERLTGFCQLVMDWFLLSVAWMFGLTLGFVVVGFAPATCALMGTAHERFTNGSGVSPWVLYWRKYRKWFTHSFRVLLPTNLILACLLGDYVFTLRLFGEEMGKIIAIFAGFLIVVVGLSLIHQIREVDYLDYH